MTPDEIDAMKKHFIIEEASPILETTDVPVEAHDGKKRKCDDEHKEPIREAEVDAAYSWVKNTVGAQGTMHIKGYDNIDLRSMLDDITRDELYNVANLRKIEALRCQYEAFDDGAYTRGAKKAARIG